MAAFLFAFSTKKDVIWRMKFYKTKYFAIIAITMFCLLFSIFGYAAYNNAQFQSTSQQIFKANQVITKTVAVVDATKSIISRQESYLFTQDESFLAGYDDLKGQVSQDIADLFSLTENNGAQTSRLTEFQDSYLELIQRMDEQRRRIENGDTSITNLDLNIDEDLNRTLTAILAAENEKLNGRILSLASLQNKLLAGVIIGVLLTGFIIGALNYYLYKLRDENFLIGDTLSYTEERLKFALDASQEGVYDWDIATGHIFFSKIYCSMLGYETHEVTPNLDVAQSLIHEDDRMIVMDAVDRFRNNKLSEFSMQFRMYHKDGHILWVNSRAIALRDDDGIATRLIGTHRDMTDYKLTESKLEKAVIEAQKSAEAKGDFLAHMSHEIRTPLTAISGISEILSKHVDGMEERQKQLVKTLSTSTASLKDLINDILDFSKIEGGDIELYQDFFLVSELAEQIVSIIGVTANEKGLDFKVDYDDVRKLVFMGDKARMRQILLNLVGNAVKFTKQGSVHVAFSMQDIEAEMPTLSVEITDTGIGFNKDVFQDIFKEFKQADSTVSREFGGTGLGLPISKKLATMMGGDIMVESEAGKGSTFTLILPIIDHKIVTDINDDGLKQKLTKRLRSAINNEQRALVVEDYEGNVVILSFLMEEIGLNYDIARNGQEALNLWHENHYDVVLMDVQMPILDGLSATKAIRKLEQENKLPETPIIGMTAHALVEDRQKCIDSGMSDYLPKPLDSDRLKEKIFNFIRESKVQTAYMQDNKKTGS